MATRVLLGILFLIQGTASAQATAPSTPAPPAAEAGTSNDLFVMFGSDFVRPGLEPKANYNIGLGHTFAFMKNFGLPKTKRLTGYTWVQGGITSMTGNQFVENRFYNGDALGLIVHFNDHNSIWIQEMFNKLVTIPWYTTASVGYTRSW
jgi:hypothetical protein